MKNGLKRIYSSLELLRYKILAEDSITASVFRRGIYLLYPILCSKMFLRSKLINYRNREDLALFDMINNAAKGDKKLYKDMALCWYFYHIVPWEYQLYHFENQSHKDRMNWLSDADRYMCCEILMGYEIYRILKNKLKFYQLLKRYYKRPLFVFSKHTAQVELEKFVQTHSRSNFFVKPLEGSLGRDTFLVSTEIEKEKLYLKLKETESTWLIEGEIKQIQEMAKWNSSSVNTIRIPSFRENDECYILQPFFRTGRKGQIVDNAGAGGILCVVDSDTGKIITDGFDEKSNIYEFHPDSHVRYKGWEIPKWKELTNLVKIAHQTLPSDFKYVGFDFALTDNGWDLIEGNWGQFVGQIAAQTGIKGQFDKYLGLRKQ